MSDGRAEAIRSAAEALARAAGALSSEWLKSPGERDEVSALYDAVVDAANAVRDPKDFDTLRRLERDRLRPLAQSLRQYARRCHLQIIRCPWPRAQADPNTCAIVAGGGYAELVAAAEQIGLRPNKPLVGQPAELDLWRQVASAEVLLVDIRQSERQTHWPRICYALGLALTIGRVIVVATDCPIGLPFDLCATPFDRSARQQPHTLSETLAAASCQACIGPRDPATVVAAAKYALEVDPPTDAWTRHTASRVAERAAQPEIDPIAIRRAIEGHVSRPAGAYRVENSSFRPLYPQQGRRHCFHVLPFDLPKWVSHAARDACEPGIIYERGDTKPDLEILERIWNGIGQASLIVIDLTGVNPNVCLEFAVARVLGRALLVCHDRATWDRTKLFPEIAHLSVELYSDQSELSSKVRTKLKSI